MLKRLIMESRGNFIGGLAVVLAVGLASIVLADPTTTLILIVLACVIVSLFVYFKRSQSTIEADVRVPQYSRMARRIALISLVAVLLILTLAISIDQYERRRLPSKIIILIADFVDSDPVNTRLTQNVYEKMRDATKRYPDLEVRLLGSEITFKQGSEFARSIGEEQKASIVVWGSCGMSRETGQATVAFEILDSLVGYTTNARDVRIPCVLDTIEKPFTFPLESLEHFTVQIDIARQLNALTLMTVGLARLQARDSNAAIDHFNDALNQWSGKGPILEGAEIYFWRAKAYESRGESDSAISDYTTLLQLKPRIASAHNNRGILYSRSGYLDKALKDYDAAISLGSDCCLTASYVNRADLYVSQKDYDKAIEDYSQVIFRKPDAAGALYARGAAYSNKGEYEKAIEDYNAAINLDSTVPCIFNDRAVAYSRKGDSVRAIEDYTRAIELSPNESHFFANRAASYHKIDEIAKALDDYRAASALDPNNSLLYMSQAHLCHHLGYYEKAIANYQRAIETTDDLQLRNEAAEKRDKIYRSHRSHSR